MKTFTLICLMMAFYSQPSAQFLQADSNRVTRQCSLIRELITIGLENHFAPIQLQQTGSTYGYRPNGTWEFATTRYDAGLKWPGANRSYLENYIDKAGNAQTDTWQYIAEYTRIPDAISAASIYAYLNKQIEGCRFPLNDSTEVDFRSLPADSLPADRPAALETASLYGLPLLEKRSSSTIHVMVGMEKRINSYNVSLIVENVVKSARPATAKK